MLAIYSRGVKRGIGRGKHGRKHRHKHGRREMIMGVQGVYPADFVRGSFVAFRHLFLALLFSLILILWYLTGGHLSFSLTGWLFWILRISLLVPMDLDKHSLSSCLWLLVWLIPLLLGHSVQEGLLVAGMSAPGRPVPRRLDFP